MATGVPFLLAISKAGADPGSASMAMADDLAGLRRLVLGMVVMVDGSPCDVNVQDGITTTVYPRREGEIVVVGALRAVLDYDEGV